MYNIHVISTSNILVLRCTAVPVSPLLQNEFQLIQHTRFFRISVVNILVLVCTTYPLFPYFCSKHTSYNMCNIPFFLYFNSKHTSFIIYNIPVFSVLYFFSKHRLLVLIMWH